MCWIAEAVPRPGARVRLVPAHDAGPLFRRHRAGAGVGQQVDQDVLGRDAEEVPVGRLEDLASLIAAGHAQRLDRLDPERLDDPLHTGDPLLFSSSLDGFQKGDVAEATRRANAHDRSRARRHGGELQSRL